MSENQVYIKKSTLVLLLALIIVAVTVAGVFASSNKEENPSDCQSSVQWIVTDDLDCETCFVSNCPLR